MRIAGLHPGQHGYRDKVSILLQDPSGGQVELKLMNSDAASPVSVAVNVRQADDGGFWDVVILDDLNTRGAKAEDRRKTAKQAAGALRRALGRAEGEPREFVVLAEEALQLLDRISRRRARRKS